MSDETRLRGSGTDGDPIAVRDHFVRQVRDALSHLHDPGHLQRHPLTRFVQGSSRYHNAGQALRQALVDAVESLRPRPDLSPTSVAWRSYRILSLRYAEALDAAQVMDRLSLSRSVYYAAQQQALEALAAVLAERWGVDGHQETVAADPEAHARPYAGIATQTIATRTNLPLPLTSFVGREREMAEVRRLLGQARLLTLTGAGGCGKTRLATEMARAVLSEQADAYPDGVWLVSLAALADSRLVPQTVATALGVREVSGQPILDTVVAYLRSRHLLLLLDNCEHLLDACASLSDTLLGSCPALAILATSRQSLGISGEVTLRVPSLDCPLPDEGESGEAVLQAVLASDASRLFVDRATAVLPSFAPSTANSPAMAEICRRLDGIPLAIELAAARVRALSPEQIAARLDHDFRLLTGGNRAALPRHQTLAATLDWSHDLLDEPERVLFHRLAVFAGGFTLEAAEQVCSGEGIEEPEVVDLLAQLVDKSLIEVLTTEGEARFRLLEPIREYALDRLLGSGEESSTRDRHLNWCLELAERGAVELGGRVQGDWVRRFEREHDNLRGALAWGLERKGEPDAACRLGIALGRFWQAASLPVEARTWLGRLVSTDVGSPTSRIRVLWLASEVEAHLGNHRRAQVWREEALALARRSGDKRLIAVALQHASFFAFDSGDLSEARRLQKAALDLADESGDELAILDILGHLSGTLARLDDPGAIRLIAGRGLALSRLFGHRFGIALFTSHLAYASLWEGDFDRARALGEQSLAEAMESANPYAEALTFRLLGDIARSAGDLDTAGTRYREMLEVWRRGTGNRLYTSGLLASMAGLELALGNTLRGLRVLAAVDGWMALSGMPLPWNPGVFYERDAATARRARDESENARAFAEGQAMTLEEAVEYALEDDDG